MTNCLKWWTSTMLISLLVSACGPGTKAEQKELSGPYFSLATYFQHEIDRLTQSGQTVNKSVTLDGKLEEQQAEQVDFSDELNLFLKADINRPAWTDKYQVDSLLEDGKLIALRYAALDTSLSTQVLHVLFAPDAANEEVSSIEIISRTETALSSSDKLLWYDPNEGYTIKATQSGTMTADLQLLVEAKFTKQN